MSPRQSIRKLTQMYPFFYSDSIDQRDEELRSSLRMFNPKMLQETELLLKIERKI